MRGFPSAEGKSLIDFCLVQKMFSNEKWKPLKIGWLCLYIPSRVSCRPSLRPRQGQPAPFLSVVKTSDLVSPSARGQDIFTYQTSTLTHLCSRSSIQCGICCSQERARASDVFLLGKMQLSGPIQPLRLDPMLRPTPHRPMRLNPLRGSRKVD